MAAPRSITIDGMTFVIVNEVDNGQTVIVDAIAPDQMAINIAVLNSRSSDLALGPILVAAWGQSLGTRRAPL